MQLLRYVNDFLDSDYTKLDHLKDGVAFCQIIDATYPGKFPLNRLNFSTKNDDENVRNLKLLDQAFRALGIQKEIPFQKIAAGTFQDNLEFLQWCLHHMQRVNAKARDEYRAHDRRAEAQAQRARKAPPVSGTPAHSRAAAAAARGAPPPSHMAPNRSHGRQSSAGAGASAGYGGGGVRDSHDDLGSGYFDDEEIFYAADAVASMPQDIFSRQQSQQPQQQQQRSSHMHQNQNQYRADSAPNPSSSSSSSAATAAAGSSNFRRGSTQNGWLSGGGDTGHFSSQPPNLNSDSAHHMHIITSSGSVGGSGAFPYGMDAPLSPQSALLSHDQVDDEQTWLKKRAELEELMLSLQSDLQYRLQAQQENVEALLAFKRERDFYLSKSLQIEHLCRRFARRRAPARSALVDEIARTLAELGPLDTFAEVGAYHREASPALSGDAGSLHSFDEVGGVGGESIPPLDGGRSELAHAHAHAHAATESSHPHDVDELNESGLTDVSTEMRTAADEDVGHAEDEQARRQQYRYQSQLQQQQQQQQYQHQHQYQQHQQQHQPFQQQQQYQQQPQQPYRQPPSQHRMPLRVQDVPPARHSIGTTRISSSLQQPQQRAAPAAQSAAPREVYIKY